MKVLFVFMFSFSIPRDEEKRKKEKKFFLRFFPFLVPSPKVSEVSFDAVDFVDLEVNVQI